MRQIIGLTLAALGGALITAAAAMLDLRLGMLTGGGFLIYTAKALAE